MSTTASFVIDFGSLDKAFLVAELDSVRNNGKTSFIKGDVVHFRIYSDVAYTIETTSGVVSNGTVDKTEAIIAEVCPFVKGEAANTNKRIATIDAMTWYGNNLGAITKIEENKVQAANADSTTLGIASLDYTTKYNEHSITPPGGMSDLYHLLVYIKAVG